MAGKQQQKSDFWTEAARQGTAFSNGLGDALTAGLGKPVGAGLSAAFGGGTGATFGDRYKSIRQQQAAQQLYEEQHYPATRNLGLGVGTGALVLASDGLAEVPAGARIVEQTIRKLGSPVSPFEQYARLGGAAATAGAGTGLLGQTTVDLAQGRLPSPSELAGAAAGGAVNHGVQSLLRGEPMPWAKVQQDTATGSLLGFGAGALTDAHLENLPWQQKGHLGETLSEIKSRVLGDPFIDTHESIPVSGGRTVADGLLAATAAGLPRGAEAKFGSAAALSKRQTEALREIGPEGRYYVDHFLPADGAKAVGGAAAIAGAGGSSAAGGNNTDDDDDDEPSVSEGQTPSTETDPYEQD